MNKDMRNYLIAIILILALVFLKNTSLIDLKGASLRSQKQMLLVGYLLILPLLIFILSFNYKNDDINKKKNTPS